MNFVESFGTQDYWMEEVRLSGNELIWMVSVTVIILTVSVLMYILAPRLFNDKTPYISFVQKFCSRVGWLGIGVSAWAVLREYSLSLFNSRIIALLVTLFIATFFAWHLKSFVVELPRNVKKHMEKVDREIYLPKRRR